MTDVLAVTIGLSVSAHSLKIIGLISGSNFFFLLCLEWVEDFKSSRERFQHALIMPPLLFSHLQVHGLNASAHMSAGLESQLCFDVEEAYNWHVVRCSNRQPPQSLDLLACLDAGSVRQRRRWWSSAEGAEACKAVTQMFGSCLISPSAPLAPAPLKH